MALPVNKLLANVLARIPDESGWEEESDDKVCVEASTEPYYLSCGEDQSHEAKDRAPATNHAARIHGKSSAVCSTKAHAEARLEAKQKFSELFFDSFSSTKDLLATNPEKLLELFRYFDRDELKALAQSRIKSEEDIDALITGVDVLYRVKELSPTGEDWILFLDRETPCNTLLKEYSKDLLSLINQMGPQYFRLKNILNQEYPFWQPDRETGARRARSFFDAIKGVQSPEEITRCAALFLNHFLTPEEAAEILNGRGAHDTTEGPMSEVPRQDSSVEASNAIGEIFKKDMWRYYNWIELVPAEFWALIESAPERVLELVRAFNPEDIKALTNRIKDRDDLETILANRDLILDIKCEHFTEYALKQDSRAPEDWYRYLANFPANVVLTKYRDDFLKLFEHIGGKIIEIDLDIEKREEDASKISFFFKLANAVNYELEGEIKYLALLIKDSTLGIDDLQKIYFHAERWAKKFNNTNPVCSIPYKWRLSHPQLYATLSNIGSNIGSDDRTKAVVTRSLFNRILQTFSQMYQAKNVDTVLKFIDASLDGVNFCSADEGPTIDHQNQYFKSLESFLNRVPKKFASDSDNADVAADLVRRVGLQHAGSILQSILRLPDTSFVDVYLRNVDGHTNTSPEYIPYLESIGCPESVFKKLIKKRDIELEDLFTDYRTGEDFSDISLSRRDTYAMLARTLAAAGHSRKFDQFVREAKFERLEKELAGKNFLEKIGVLKEFSEAIDPKIWEVLRNRFLAKEMSKPGGLRGILKSWHNAKSDMIDVTKNNIANINNLLTLLGDIKEWPGGSDLNAELAHVFSNYISQKDNDQAITWLANALDVEEMDTNGIKQMGTLASYIELQSIMERLFNKPGARYLGNKFKEIDLLRVFSDGTSNDMTLDLKKLEQFRRDINTRDKKLGDQFVERVGTSFLESHTATLDNITDLLKFARAWSMANISGVERDVLGLYEGFSQFAFDAAADFI
ncbi:MAG: hypothetical protein Q7T03_00110, partial [Deltaproteobacteria bacterium]|nr:hypothetical protein [Deltaproteobacteria bacterium]